jgi:UDP-2,3-diacylglucosamine hydrolase
MKTLVFSDVHLNVARDGREQMDVFVSFLRSIDASEVDRIVILGDLFDFWFEYRHVIFSGYFDVLCALAELRDAGVEFHFVCGNHDFWAGRFLMDRLDFTIYREPGMLEFGDKRVLFVHGDGLNPKDYGYRFYKRIARAKPVIRLFSLIHPDWAMAIAQGVSRTSRHAFQARDLSQGPEVKPLQAFAAAALAEGRADVVMCGHSHYPVVEEHPTPKGMGLYINTGDWLYHRSYVEWDGSRFHLRYYDPAEVPAEVPVE